MKKADADAKKRKEWRISDVSLKEFKKDLKDIEAGTLKSPSTDYRFVWDPESGARYLFKGTIDTES